MKNLANKEIKVLNAVTRVNSKSNSSRITGKTIKIGALHFEREDGNFYHCIIDGDAYQVFHRFENNQLELDRHFCKRSKTIYIDNFEIIEDAVKLNSRVIMFEVEGVDLLGILSVNQINDGYLNYIFKYSAFTVDSDTPGIKEILKKAKTFCENRNINLMMY